MLTLTDINRALDRLGVEAFIPRTDRRHGPRRLPARPPRDARRRATPGRGRRRTAQPGAPCDGAAPVYAMKRPRIVALLGLLAALGEAPLLHAQAPEECRRQCSLDLVACQNACLDGRDFDGCLEECHSAEEDCLSGCR